MTLFSISFNACMYVSNNGTLLCFFFIVVLFTCLAFDNLRNQWRVIRRFHLSTLFI
jgi:hypothetical protein